MEAHQVSASSKALFKKVRQIVPPMLERFHKGKPSRKPKGYSPFVFSQQELIVSTGQHGRVAVIGGCAEYVDCPEAPYA